MYRFFSSFWFSGRYKKTTYVSDAKVQKFRLARSARSQPLMGFSRVSGRYKSSWTRPYNECYEHKDTFYRQTMWFTNTILRRIACFRVQTHTKKMACSQIAIIYSFFSSFWSVCKTFFRRKSTNILARSLRSLDIIFFKFLVSNEQDHITSVTNTVMDILYRQTVINQQCILLRFEKNRMFSTQILKNRLARFARSQSCIHFLQFPTRRHSIRPHEHIKWTNTRTYCADKNMLLTNLTIARFSTRKIRKFRLARSQSVTYIIHVRIVKKKGGKPYYQLSTTTENLVTPAPPTPDKGSIREIATGEITLPITPDDHLEGPYLLKTRELPGAPPPGPPAGALPLHPARGPTAGPWTPPRMRRALTRTDFSAHPFFANPGSATVHIPPCSSKSLAPRGVDPGGAGEQSPPPPWKYWGGGKHIVLPPPPPPNNFVNLKNW